MGSGGCLGDFCLGHHSGAVAGAVCNLDHEGLGVLATDEAWHQSDTVTGFKVHVSDVAGVHQLVVDEDPSGFGLRCLLNQFVLCHLDSGVPRCVCYLYAKHGIFAHGIAF